MTGRGESGYSLIELMVSVAILTIVSGTALEGVFRLTKVSQTVSNRTEMHSGVRNATELLQQEVGQAGRIALLNTVQLNAAVTTTGTAVAVGVKAVDEAGNTLSTPNGTDGMFIGEQIVVDTGSNEETVTITGVDPANRAFSAVFTIPHAASAPVNVYGGFAYGVIPKTNSNGTTFTNGSTGTVMKILGDINSDGSLKYLEYTCDTAGGNLYRRTMAYDANTKPANSVSMALLNNITANPDGSDCFTYQQKSVNNIPYVVDVAITLTVRTPDRDPVTGLYQTETKALLNVSPRNVFNVWQLAGLGISNRVQPLPTSVATLMALP
ncbi:MAG TPA: prepilin-type N-terminal cleavage/methylation domain-containing protein [Vicinamibacterales bacterium]|nr:prepilin-type N-terminal cleavage/methylation domain-containing protein [Vicinamibacterales bacterium]